MALTGRLAAGAAVMAAITGLALARQDGDVGVKIGPAFPFLEACYRMAVDGATGAEGLEPCDRSLANEPLTDRLRSIVYANRGVVQFNSGDYGAAAEDFTAALNLGINVRARILVNRGLCFEALRYDSLARADYEAALDFNPDNEIALRRLEELKKPTFERSGVPRRITADAGRVESDGS